MIPVKEHGRVLKFLSAVGCFMPCGSIATTNRFPFPFLICCLLVVDSELFNPTLLKWILEASEPSSSYFFSSIPGGVEAQSKDCWIFLADRTVGSPVCTQPMCTGCIPTISTP